MRHKTYDKTFRRSPEHRKAMFNNMATSLFKHERIETTLEKARVLRSKAERMITLAKKQNLAEKGNVSYTRLIARDVKDKDIINKLVTKIAPRYKDINGGYTRILKLKNRKGDNALIVIIELTMREKKVKKEDKTKGKEKEVPVKK